MGKGAPLNALATAARNIASAARSPSGAAIILAATMAVIAVLLPFAAQLLGSVAIVVGALALLYRLRRQEVRSDGRIAREAQQRNAATEAVQLSIRRAEADAESALADVHATLKSAADEERRVREGADRAAADQIDRLHEAGETLQAEMHAATKHRQQLAARFERTNERVNERIDRLGRRVTKERSRRIVDTAELATEGHEPHRVVVIVAMQRTASTLLLDTLRAVPGVDLWPTARYWRAMGLDGRRYPADLSNGPQDRLGLEVADGLGETVPSKGPVTLRPPTIAVEKAHPEFYSFEGVRWADRLRRLATATEVLPIFLVREPLDCMWSMLEYQQRNPKWYPWLDESEIPAFVYRSVSSLEATARAFPGPVITYRDVVTRSPRLGEVVSWCTGSPIQPAEHTPESRPASQAATGAGLFRGERSAARTSWGPMGSWAENYSEIDEASAIYRRLLVQKSDS